jgi:periplasmic divalent cation tolerance protein
VHPYEVPEILAVPVIAGNKAYLAWMEDEIGGTV